MTLTNHERCDALLHMVATGSFADDVVLARWSVSAEAEPHLRRWRRDSRKPLPTSVGDVDLDVARREIAEQDALVEHIQQNFGSGERCGENDQTIIDMFELGWFGQGSPFWRWIDTSGAQPFIAACAEMRRASERDGRFDVFTGGEEAAAIISDPERLAAFAAWIEATFVEPPPMKSPRS